MEPKELNQVRQIIEKSTSKVSLRDLERKGFRKVKVLRSTDIDNMIQRAVADALSAGERDREKLLERSRQALQQQMEEFKSQAQAAKEADELIARLTDQGQAAETRAQELEQRLAEAEARLRDAEARAGKNGAADQQRLAEAERRTRESDERARDIEERARERERRLEAVSRRLEEAEARALGAESRAQTAERRMGDLSQSQLDLDNLRLKLKQIETEKRLVEELEVPRLRQHIEELEGDIGRLRAAQPSGEDMRKVLREMLKELNVGAATAQPGGATSPELLAQLGRLEGALASIGGKSVAVGLSDKNAATAVRLSLDELFTQGDKAMQTNIDTISVKETTSKGVGSNIDKLKNLRKKS